MRVVWITLTMLWTFTTGTTSYSRAEQIFLLRLGFIRRIWPLYEEKMTPMTEESEVTFNCPISLAPEHIGTVASENLEVVLPSGWISRAESKEHSRYVKHESQRQQKKWSAEQVQLRNWCLPGTQHWERCHWMERAQLLDSESSSYIHETRREFRRRLKVHLFDSTKDPEIEQKLFRKKLYSTLQNSCFLLR